MDPEERLRRYLETGAILGEMTFSRAQEILKALAAQDQGERDRAWRELDRFSRLGRKVAEECAAVLRSEVSRQVGGLGSLDEVLARVSRVLHAYGGEPDGPRPPRAPGQAGVIEASGLYQQSSGAPGKPKKHKPAKTRPTSSGAGASGGQKSKQKKHKKAKVREDAGRAAETGSSPMAQGATFGDRGPMGASDPVAPH
ncbi:MAG: hypothetical protein ACRDVP_01995 [Acidimicrobiales bacterium]